jgi:hypothetical protein
LSYSDVTFSNAPLGITANKLNRLRDDLEAAIAAGGGGGAGDMTKAVYDTNNNGKVDTCDSLPWGSVTGKPSTFPPDSTAMLKSVYDTNADNIVDHAALSDAVPWTGVTGKPATFPPSAHAPSHNLGGSDAIAPDWTQVQNKPATFAPNAHATSHLDNGADPIAVVTTTRTGLTPKLSGTVNTFLNGTGTYTTPAGAGDMTKAVYDTNNDSIVDHAALADAAPWTGITGKPSTFAPSAHASSHVTGGSDIIASVAAAASGLVPSPASAAQKGFRTNSAGTPSWRNLEFFNIVDFGADPTGGVDSTAAINAAISAAPAGSLIWVPIGYYVISSTIVLSKPLNFCAPNGSTSGAGYAAFVATTATMVLMDIQCKDACIFENLVFNRAVLPTSGSTAYGTRVSGNSAVTIENLQSQWINCSFANHYIGIYFLASESFICDRCTFTSNVATTYGVYIDEAVNAANGGSSFVSCNFFGNHFSGTAGIFQISASDILVTGCKFYDHDYSIYTQLKASANCYGLIVTGCTLGDYAVDGIFINNLNTGASLFDILITGNEFAGKPSSASHCIMISSASGAVYNFSIVGNVFLVTGTSSGIYCTGPITDGVINGNSIYCQVAGGIAMNLDASTARILVSQNHMAGSNNRITNSGTTNVLIDDEGTLQANLPAAAASGSRIYCSNNIKGPGDAGYTAGMVLTTGGTGAWLHRKGTTWYAF